MKKYEKNVIIAISFVIVVSLFLAFIFYLSLTTDKKEAAGLTNPDWLNFWGSYAGSILALMGVLIAIIYSNHNSERAIQQQNKMLRFQRSSKEMEDRNLCLKNILDLMNVAEIKGMIGCINQEALTLSKEKVVQKKALIFSCDLQLRYVYGFDTDMKQTKVDLDYFDSWNKCRAKLSDLLDKYMDLVELIAQNKFDSETKKMEAQLFSLNKQMFEATSNIQNKNICYSEMIDHSHNIEKLEEQLNGYCKKVDTLVKEYSQMTSELLLMVKDLFNKSILVQIENRQILQKEVQS